MTVTTRPKTIPAISTDEFEHHRHRAFERANHSLRLEGLTVTPAADAIAQAWLRGEISDEERADRTRALHISQS